MPPPPPQVSFSGRAPLLDGTPVTFGRVVALRPLEGKATRDVVQPFAPSYKELASAHVDSLGRFRLGPLESGSYDLAITATPMYICATQLIGEQSGEGPVDVRFDATLVELLLPDAAGARPHPEWGIWCRSRGRTNDVGLAAIEGDTRSGGAAGHTFVTFNENGIASLLLPSGPGFFIVATPDQVPGAARQLAASLESGLPSGVVRLPLTAEVASFATVDVSVTGAPLSAGELLMVSLRPLGGKFETYAAAPVFFGEEDGALECHGRLLVPPGTYVVKTLIAGSETLDASVSRAAITVSAGRVQRVAVHLSRMGELAIEIEAEGEGHHLRFVFERWDEVRDVWVLLPVHTMSSRGIPQSAPGVPLGSRRRVLSPLPGGSLRVRLRREGWRTQEATVTIRPGELVVWRTIVERLD